MKYPNLSEKDIMRSIQLRIEHPEYNYNNRPTTLNEFIDGMKNEAKKDDGRLYQSLMVYRENKDLLTDESIVVINKLLGDKKIRDKIRLINDGSYFVNRIWGHVVIKNEKIEICPEFNGPSIDIDSSRFDELSVKKKIDWLYNHFDNVYVQIPLVKTRQDILKKMMITIIQKEYYTSTFFV